MSGNKHTYSEIDLSTIALSYNPSLKLAPVVVGHPIDDKPIYGYVKKLVVHNCLMFAEIDNLNGYFESAVKEGRYKKISVAFYTPNDTNNPIKGQYYLRHVGFLGAAAPAVNDLGAVSFCEIDLTQGNVFRESNDDICFSCPVGYLVSDNIKTHERVLQYQYALNISYDEALKII